MRGGIPAPAPAPAHPIAVPPNGAIATLYHGAYTAAEFDTPAETALRVGKLLKAVNELVELLKAAGVVV